MNKLIDNASHLPRSLKMLDLSNNDQAFFNTAPTVQHQQDCLQKAQNRTNEVSFAMKLPSYTCECDTCTSVA